MPKAKKNSELTDTEITESLVALETKVVELLKARLPACFEREPAPAFATGNLSALANDIIKMILTY